MERQCAEEAVPLSLTDWSKAGAGRHTSAGTMARTPCAKSSGTSSGHSTVSALNFYADGSTIPNRQ
jgi:hypothetical protein